ncbi:hypothetical protein ASPCADRAFT_4334 [Aspergillus carbonarius ITEM 5010]|uniref:Uncharacterized protein n=1 Tax=Aspergillus carbonarius (strain ITEM 5010) TaxID=602072 RepID=A0A1R3RP59_ASPC5|nr:hypothetical protein ASPCADRAFT_4296 [Aspergillus carbonarius ITEM 5010]OOF96297.1 hypothetical protein ASPCADRAFT_4334 [Aspergillus carbonarius ITEM 5010]
MSPAPTEKVGEWKGCGLHPYDYLILCLWMARYKLFVGPFAKVFLGAIFTYQVLYWTWLKLEMVESKYEKNQEVAALEQKAKELTGAQK